MTLKFKWQSLAVFDSYIFPGHFGRRPALLQVQDFADRVPESLVLLLQHLDPESVGLDLILHVKHNVSSS